LFERAGVSQMPALGKGQRAAVSHLLLLVTPRGARATVRRAPLHTRAHDHTHLAAPGRCWWPSRASLHPHPPPPDACGPCARTACHEGWWQAGCCCCCWQSVGVADH
jgi:hypothetical protein